MAKTRVTITIGAELVEGADRRAHAMGRSRSWVLAEALGAYLSAPSGVVREAATPYASGLGASRLAQLAADADLTPEERVVLAEETALVSELSRRRARCDQVITFESVEDFHRWERREALDP